MSVKKYLGLTAVGLASLAATSAMAGGPDVAPAPMDYSGFYIDGDLGWGGTNWSDFVGGVYNPTGFAGSSGAVTGDGNGGFAWGGDVGYQFNQNFSFEAGAYDLQSVTGDAGNNTMRTLVPPTASSGAVKVTSWVLYVAGKLSIPLFENFDMFGKAGIAWRFLSYSGIGLTGPTGLTLGVRQTFNDQHYATWVAGAGFQYWITPEWSLNVQYLHIPGYNRAQEIAQQSPNVNLVVAGAGYKFMS